jgi:hypothetical protein
MGATVIGAHTDEEVLRFLVTVKTYPNPSIKHLETVCTGGITRDGRWIRLYPVPFRYLRSKYRLYDWVEVTVRRRPAQKDKRKESYEPVSEPIVVGQVTTRDNWRERKAIVLPHASRSIEELRRCYERDGTSLGIIRPAQVIGVVVRRETREWSPAHRKLFEQPRLFGPRQKALEKPGHSFSYRFRCEDEACKGHCLQILDWGVSALYLRTKNRDGELKAVEKTEAKCWELAGEDRDTYLYVGTSYPYRTFMVLGMFYPKKEPPNGRIPLRFG